MSASEDTKTSPSVLSRHDGSHWLESDAYLFDIDGTLLNTQDLIHYRALNRAMRDIYGADTTIDGIAYHGKTDLSILRAALQRAGVTDDVFASKLPAALEVVRHEVDLNAHALVAKVCASIPELLAKLQSAGKMLGVASGNLQVVGWHKVESAGLRNFFTFGCFADHYENREDIFQCAVEEVRRRLRPGVTVCFIGDTPSDIRAARHAGARVIAVATGIHKREDLLSHGPDFCVGSCAELLQVVAK